MAERAARRVRIASVVLAALGALVGTLPPLLSRFGLDTVVSLALTGLALLALILFAIGAGVQFARPRVGAWVMLGATLAYAVLLALQSWGLFAVLLVTLRGAATVGSILFVGVPLLLLGLATWLAFHARRVAARPERQQPSTRGERRRQERRRR